MSGLARLALLPAGTVLLLIRCYQAVVSPFLPRACRFEPSCSCYAHDAIARHGLLRGAWLAVRRIIRCRPGPHGGFDPVP